MHANRRRLLVALSIGFAALLLLTTLGSLITLRKSFAIFAQLGTAHETHDRVADALSRLRSDLYLAGILKRDFLLDRNDEPNVSYGAQFAQIQASVESDLKTVESMFGSRHPELVRLRSEVSAYMRPMREALDWEPVAVPSLRSYLLRLQLRQRTAALQIATEIEKLNRDALANQQKQIAASEDEFRRTLLWILTIGVLLGSAIAVTTVLYTRRLGKESEEAQQELRRLSQHVVRVQEYERKSISRELHDEVGQLLTGLRMELANLDAPFLQAAPEDYQRLQEAKRLAERSLQGVRDLSMLLRPSMLDDLGILPALNWQAKEFSRRTGIPVDVAVHGDIDDMPEDLRTCVYRVIQEALTNAARHAHAKRVKIAVQRWPEEWVVCVEDDGVGFVTARPRGRQGLGLVGMKERITELSGKVMIDSAPGRGTKIVARIPAESAVKA